MNVLFLTHSLSDKLVGGETRIAWELANALAKKGVRVFAAAPYVEPGIKSRLPENIKVYRVPFCSTPELNRSNMLKAFLFLWPLLFLKGIDVIHLASSHGPCPFSRFKFGRVFVESADVEHDYNDKKIKKELWADRREKRETMALAKRPGAGEKIFRRFASFFYRLFKLNEKFPLGVDAFACRSSAAIEHLKKIKHPAKLVYAPNGVNPEEFHPALPPAFLRDKFTFLFVGKLTRTKGLLYLLEAFQYLKKEYPKTALFLVGRGSPPAEKEIKEKAGEIPDVHFLGEKPADEIGNYYTACDVFVMPSLSEGFGMANAEAMACGKPVISTKVGGIVDVVRDGETGFLAEKANALDLCEKMKKAIENLGKLKEMGERGRQRALENFSWEVVAEKTIEGYEAVLNEYN